MGWQFCKGTWEQGSGVYKICARPLVLHQVPWSAAGARGCVLGWACVWSWVRYTKGVGHAVAHSVVPGWCGQLQLCTSIWVHMRWCRAGCIAGHGGAVEAWGSLLGTITGGMWLGMACENSWAMGLGVVHVDSLGYEAMWDIRGWLQALGWVWCCGCVLSTVAALHQASWAQHPCDFKENFPWAHGYGKQIRSGWVLRTSWFGALLAGEVACICAAPASHGYLWLC